MCFTGLILLLFMYTYSGTCPQLLIWHCTARLIAARTKSMDAKTSETISRCRIFTWFTLLISFSVPVRSATDFQALGEVVQPCCMRVVITNASRAKSLTFYFSSIATYQWCLKLDVCLITQCRKQLLIYGKRARYISTIQTFT